MTNIVPLQPSLSDFHDNDWWKHHIEKSASTVGAFAVKMPRQIAARLEAAFKRISMDCSIPTYSLDVKQVKGTELFAVNRCESPHTIQYRMFGHCMYIDT